LTLPRALDGDCVVALLLLKQLKRCGLKGCSCGGVVCGVGSAAASEGYCAALGREIAVVARGGGA